MYSIEVPECRQRVLCPVIADRGLVSSYHHILGLKYRGSSVQLSPYPSYLMAEIQGSSVQLSPYPSYLMAEIQGSSVQLSPYPG